MSEKNLLIKKLDFLKFHFPQEFIYYDADDDLEYLQYRFDSIMSKIKERHTMKNKADLMSKLEILKIYFPEKQINYNSSDSLEELTLLFKNICHEIEIEAECKHIKDMIMLIPMLKSFCDKFILDGYKSDIIFMINNMKELKYSEEILKKLVLSEEEKKLVTETLNWIIPICKEFIKENISSFINDKGEQMLNIIQKVEEMYFNI